MGADIAEGGRIDVAPSRDRLPGAGSAAGGHASWSGYSVFHGDNADVERRRLLWNRC
jgi:hypothetical protein